MGSFTQILFNFNKTKKNLNDAIVNSKWEKSNRENVLSALVSMDLAKTLCISKNYNKMQLSDEVYTDETRTLFTDLDTGIISLKVSVIEHNINGDETEVAHVIISDPNLIVKSCNEVFCKQNNKRNVRVRK